MEKHGLPGVALAVVEGGQVVYLKGYGAAGASRPMTALTRMFLVVVFWQVSAFYGTRFNLWTNLAYFRLGLPDVFILMIVGTIPDYVQRVVKLVKVGNPPDSKSLNLEDYVFAHSFVSVACRSDRPGPDAGRRFRPLHGPDASLGRDAGRGVPGAVR